MADDVDELTEDEEFVDEADEEFDGDDEDLEDGDIEDDDLVDDDLVDDDAITEDDEEDEAEDAPAKTAATKDVVKAAEEGYGNIKSHTGLKSQKVTVAGKTGYLVRWKVDAETGSDGYVQTVVFPSSQKGAFVAIHFGFDATSSAPKVSLMDQIVDGVKTYQSTGSANPTNGV